MSHPEIDNKTKFYFEFLPLADEHGSPLIVPVIKATYHIQNQAPAVLAEEQIPLNIGGEYWSNPDSSSYKYEPETAFFKPATDIVLIGHACAQKQKTTVLDVGLRLGPLQKVIRVIGDRFVVKRTDTVTLHGPKPFEKIPLIYERAFGGWDRSNPNPDKHKFEPRNPVGVGFGYPNGNPEEPIRLPNLEDPRHTWQHWGDRPPTAGFGYISPHWQPRASYAGTYDKKWNDTRKPFLPDDFDRRFFNAASPGMIAPGYLRGDEPVTIINASPTGRISFNLPGVPPPWCAIEIRGGKREILQTQLDTVTIDTDENLLILLWRAHVVVSKGPHDVLAIEIDTKPMF